MGVYLHQLVALNLPHDTGDPEYIEGLTGSKKHCNRELRALILSLMEPLEVDRPKDMKAIMAHVFFQGFDFAGFQNMPPPFKPANKSINIQENAMSEDLFDALDGPKGKEPDKIKLEDQVKFEKYAWNNDLRKPRSGRTRSTLSGIRIPSRLSMGKSKLDPAVEKQLRELSVRYTSSISGPTGKGPGGKVAAEG